MSNQEKLVYFVSYSYSKTSKYRFMNKLYSLLNSVDNTTVTLTAPIEQYIIQVEKQIESEKKFQSVKIIYYTKYGNA